MAGRKEWRWQPGCGAGLLVSLGYHRQLGFLGAACCWGWNLLQMPSELSSAGQLCSLVTALCPPWLRGQTPSNPRDLT